MGISHSWNGTILTITSDSGTSSADLKGQKGDDGARGAQGATGLSGKDAVVDLTGYATEDFVNNTIDSLNIDSYAKKATTLEEYGITNAAAKSELELKVDKVDVDALVEDIAEVNTLLEDKADKEVVSQLSNPNLLINSDFRNPVNQRGKTTYTSDATNWVKIYGIDRWRLAHGAQVTVNNGYITLKGTAVDSSFTTQEFEKALPQNDYTLTINVLDVRNGECWVSDELIESRVLVKGLNVFHCNGSLRGITLALRENTEIDIEWIKLEQGSAATPFVPRFYGEELSLCERYYQKVHCVLTQLYHEQSTANTSYIFVRERLSPIMRATPTMLSADIYNNASTRVSGVSSSALGSDIVSWIRTDTTLSTGKYYMYMVLDAEIY